MCITNTPNKICGRPLSALKLPGARIKYGLACQLAMHNHIISNRLTPLTWRDNITSLLDAMYVTQHGSDVRDFMVGKIQAAVKNRIRDMVAEGRLIMERMVNGVVTYVWADDADNFLNTQAVTVARTSATAKKAKAGKGTQNKNNGTGKTPTGTGKATPPPKKSNESNIQKMLEVSKQGLGAPVAGFSNGRRNQGQNTTIVVLGTQNHVTGVNPGGFNQEGGQGRGCDPFDDGEETGDEVFGQDDNDEDGNNEDDNDDNDGDGGGGNEDDDDDDDDDEEPDLVNAEIIKKLTSGKCLLNPPKLLPPPAPAPILPSDSASNLIPHQPSTNPQVKPIQPPSLDPEALRREINGRTTADLLSGLEEILASVIEAIKKRDEAVEKKDFVAVARFNQARNELLRAAALMRGLINERCRLRDDTPEEGLWSWLRK